MATYIKKIRTDAGDLQIDYNALANLPKYAGSSSAGGAATSANKLNTDAGSATQPVYFANGIPVKTTYTLSKSVPSNAVFTDTHYASKNVVGTTSAISNTTMALTNGSVYLNSVENGVVTSSHKISGSGATTVTADASGNIVVNSTNTTYSAATTSANGLMSAADKKTVNAVSNPNILINGDFQVWQRGASFANIENQYTADRWLIKNAKAKTATVSKSTDVPSDQPMCQSLYIKENTEENSYLRYMFEHSIKGTMTLSFWYKTTAAFNSYIYDNGALVHLGKLTTLNSWAKAVFTFTATSLTWLSIIHAMSIGSAYITGVKLEYGNVATQFAPRIYAEEIALCRRFFDIMGGTRTSGVEQDYDANTFTYAVPRNVLMRTTPTISIHGTTTTNSTDGICVRTIGCAILPGFTFTYSLRGWELLVVAKSNTALNKMCYETQLYINDAFKIYLDAEIY